MTRYYILRSTGELVQVVDTDPLWPLSSDTVEGALSSYEHHQRALIKVRHQQIDELIANIHRVRRSVQGAA